MAWRTLRCLGLDEAMLPDACQDVLLVVHRRRADYQGECQLFTWVYGIVLRVASNYRRSHKRALSVFDPRVSAETVAHSSAEPSPFERLERQQALQHLVQILERLPENLRSVLVLIELEELECAQAAELLEISESTCRSWLSRARKELNAAVARDNARTTFKTGGAP